MSKFYPAFTWAAVGGRESFPHIDLICALMPPAFTFNPEHKTLADVRDHIIAAAPMEHTLEGEVLDAKDTEFKGELRGVAGSLVIFAAIGAPEASPLMLFMDAVAGLPLVLDGIGNITIAWDNGPQHVCIMSDIQ